MRLSLVFGAGLAGVLAVSGLARGQFAGDRPPPRVPELPPGLQPLAPAQPGQPVARATYPTTPPVDEPHPWAVKAENGAFMILVKGYVGADSRKQAEALCQYIRKEKVAAYLFERNTEERKRERELQEAIRKKAEEDAQPFLQRIDQEKKRAEQQGMPFVPTAPKIKVPKPLNPTPEQWAVLIGGFPTADAARKALDAVRKIPPPADTRLLEQTVIVTPAKDGQPAKSEGTYINPFASALVVPNPHHKATAEGKGKLEPFIVELNKDVPNSLLGARKPWTLLVKSFNAPVKVEGKDGGGTVFDKAGALNRKGNFLDLTAAQATQLCEALRHRDMKLTPDAKPAPLESFILHHRTGSLVFVGQFDAPDDPELLKVQQALRAMTFQVTDDKTKATRTERMFDGIAPFPVPVK